MSESEIRAELMRLLVEAQLSEGLARTITERVMGMVEEYGSEQASEGASDAVRDYEERM